MSKRLCDSRAVADEAIRQAREACYGDASVGNTIEGDYGTWNNWRDLIQEVVQTVVMSCDAEIASITQKLAEARARIKELERMAFDNM